MSDLYLETVVSDIQTSLHTMNAWLLDYLRGGLDLEENDLFDIMGNFRVAVTNQLDNVETSITNQVQNVGIQVEAVGMRLDNLRAYLLDTVEPIITETRDIVEGNSRQLTYISKTVEEIPEKTAALVTASINDGMAQVATQLQLMRLLMETLMQDQTNRIEAAITSGNEQLSAAITAQGQAITAGIEDFKGTLTKAVSDGFTRQTESIEALRKTIETELQAIAESEIEFREAMILFVTEYWSNFEAMQNRLSTVTADGIRAERENAIEVVTKLGDESLTVASSESDDTEDYVSKYAQEFNKTHEEIV